MSNEQATEKNLPEVDNTKPLKVAIVGYASSSKDLAPFDDESWEIWGLNDLYLDIPRYNRWFQQHDEDIMRSRDRRDPNHWEWLKKCKAPIYMQKAHPEIPSSVTYPLRQVVEKFKLRYFTNSIAYMIALAMYEGASEIGVYGVDMLQDSEYAGQRACCEAWLGLASGMGIIVHLPRESALMKTNFWYGYQEKPAIGGVSEDWLHKETVRLNGEAKKLDAALRDIQNKLTFVRGALHQSQFLLQHMAHWNRGGMSLSSKLLDFPDETVKGRIENAMQVQIPEPAWNIANAAGLETAVQSGGLSIAEASNKISAAMKLNQEYLQKQASA